MPYTAKTYNQLSKSNSQLTKEEIAALEKQKKIEEEAKKYTNNNNASEAPLLNHEAERREKLMDSVPGLIAHDNYINSIPLTSEELKKREEKLDSVPGLVAESKKSDLPTPTVDTLPATNNGTLNPVNTNVTPVQPSSPVVSKNEVEKQQILNFLQQLTNTLTPSEEKQKATLATQEQIRQNLAKIMAMGENNNTQIGNLVTDSSNMIKDAYGETKKQTDSIYDYIRSNPYESDIGKSIMNYYNMQGGKGASEATAEAAATNAGNIDSYSAANANRQRLAFTNAGTEAIRNQYNATTANLLNTLQQFGINVGDLIAKHNENVKNQQAYNAELMGEYTEGAKAETNAITEAEKNRLALKSDIANYISQLLGTKSSNETQKYLGDRDTDIALRGTTTVDTATPTQIYEAFQALITGNYEGFDAVSPDEAVAVLLETYPGSKDYINSYVKQWANDLK